MQNITVSSGQARLVFKYLDWDSDHFGRNCYVLDETVSTLIADPGLSGKLINAFEDAFVTVKLLTTSNPLLLQQLQTAGFRYIETEVTLTRPKIDSASSSMIPLNGSSEVMEDVLALEIKKITDRSGFSSIDPVEIGKSFSWTRFHKDPHISRAKADSVWIEYLKNFSPSNDHFAYAAISGDKALGVILINILSVGDSARIFYVAVSQDQRGKGIGTALIKRVVEDLGIMELFVGTQVSNTSAMNFYLTSGFALVHETKTVLHLWTD